MKQKTIKEPVLVPGGGGIPTTVIEMDGHYYRTAPIKIKLQRKGIFSDVIFSQFSNGIVRLTFRSDRKRWLKPSKKNSLSAKDDELSLTTEQIVTIKKLLSQKQKQ